MSYFPSLKLTAYFEVTENNSGQDKDTKSVTVFTSNDKKSGRSDAGIFLSDTQLSAQKVI